MEATLYLTGHATDKFLRRSNQQHLNREEGRRHMRYLIAQGETGMRANEHGVDQPVVRSNGWIFVISFDGTAVVTVFFNATK